MSMSDEQASSVQRLADLGSALVSDALLDLNRPQHIARHGIRPANLSHACAGPVRTAQFEATDPKAQRDFGPLAKFVDAVGPGEVLLLASAPDVPEGAMWGDLCSSAAEAHGAKGVVIDGFMRDEQTLAQSPLPVFSRGAFSRDGLLVSNISQTDVPVTFAGVEVKPGDIVVADIDGIVFFDADSLSEVLEICEDKVEREVQLRDALEQSESSLFAAMSRLGTM